MFIAKEVNNKGNTLKLLNNTQQTQYMKNKCFVLLLSTFPVHQALASFLLARSCDKMVVNVAVLSLFNFIISLWRAFSFTSHSFMYANTASIEVHKARLRRHIENVGPSFGDRSSSWYWFSSREGLKRNDEVDSFETLLPGRIGGDGVASPRPLCFYWTEVRHRRTSGS